MSDTLISLETVFGLEIGKYSRRVFADFAGILARIAVSIGRNTCQAIMPAGNQCDNSFSIELRPACLLHFCNRRNLAWMNDHVVTQYLMPRTRYGWREALRYYVRHLRAGDIMLAIYVDGQHIGNCGFFGASGGQAELRIVIGERSLWHKGIGRSAVALMVEIAPRYQIDTIWLHVNPDNSRAVRIYEAQGFKRTGYVEIPGTPVQAKMVLHLRSLEGG